MKPQDKKEALLKGFEDPSQIYPLFLSVHMLIYPLKVLCVF